MDKKHYFLLLFFSIILFLIGLIYGIHKNNINSKSLGNLDLSGGEYVRLVFVGSSNCTFSNNNETHRMIKYIKSKVKNVLENRSINIISTGMSYDLSPKVAIEYLDKTGPYDELLVGNGPFNLGIINYLSGGSSTPKVLLFIEKYDTQLIGLNIENFNDQQKHLRTYTGLSEIQSLYKFLNISSDREVIEYLGIN